MSAISNYLENKLLDLLFRGQAYTPPASLYFASMTVAPTDAGGGTECTGGGYARVAVVRSLSNFAGTQGSGSTDASSGSGGTTSNNVDIQFPSPSANWGTVVAMGVYDAPTGGNLLLYGPVSPAKVVNSGDLPPKFAVGQWIFQIDTDVD